MVVMRLIILLGQVFGGDDGNISATYEYKRKSLGFSGSGSMIENSNGNWYDFPWKEGRVKVNSVTINNDITSISSGAFCQMGDITRVSLGNSVRSIGQQAFQECVGLTNITLPDSLSQIGYGAFIRCTNLTSINLPQNVGLVDEWAFSGCSSLESVFSSKLGTCELKSGAFYNCQKLKTVNFRDKIKVSENTFQGCHNDLVLTWFELYNPTTPVYKLSYVFKDSTLTLIYEDGYLGERDYDRSSSSWNKPSWNQDDFKPKIETIVIGDGIKKIGNYSFSDLMQLKVVRIPEGVEAIGEGAFINCSMLNNCSLPNSVTSIGKKAFAGIRWESFVIPSSVRSIGEEAFNNSWQMKTVEFLGTDCHIESAAFSSCYSLEMVKMHKGANYIASDAFENSDKVVIEWKDGEIDPINVKYYNNNKTISVEGSDLNSENKQF